MGVSDAAVVSTRKESKSERSDAGGKRVALTGSLAKDLLLQFLR